MVDALDQRISGDCRLERGAAATDVTGVLKLQN
jgi:hypothetical protein